MNVLRRSVLAVALGLLCPALLTGEEVVPLTLAEALERAERQSSDLAAVRAHAEGQGARAEAANRAAWPLLSLAADGARTDTPARVFASTLNRGALLSEDLAIERLNAPAAVSHLTTIASLHAPIDVFGRISARARGEHANARAAEAALREALQDLRFGVIGAYEHAVLARAALAVKERAVQSARAREDDLMLHVQQGAVLTADLLRVRARRRQREADLAQGREDWRVALAALSRIVGAPAGTVYDAAAGTPAGAAPEGTLDEWKKRAVDRRGAVDGAHEAHVGAESNERGERRAALPDVALYGQLQDDRGLSADGRSYAVGVAVRWTPFDPTRPKRLAAARAEVRAAAASGRAMTDQVRLEVETAFRRALSARERHEAARGGAEEGREALRIIQERRKAGRATLTDELETEAASLTAELEEVTASSSVAVADAALRRAVGVLGVTEESRW
jgi:outer membrane protein